MSHLEQNQSFDIRQFGEAITQNLEQKKLPSDPISPQMPESEGFLSAEHEPDFAQIPLEIEYHSPPESPQKPEEEDSLIGKRARVFADDWSPEAIGAIETVRGYGTLQAVEIRVLPDQPGPRLRIAYEGQWEILAGGES